MINNQIAFFILPVKGVELSSVKRKKQRRYWVLVLAVTLSYVNLVNSLNLLCLRIFTNIKSTGLKPSIRYLPVL